MAMQTWHKTQEQHTIKKSIRNEDVKITISEFPFKC